MAIDLTYVAFCSVGMQRLLEALDPLWELARLRWGPLGKKTVVIAASILLGTLGAFALRDSLPSGAATGAAEPWMNAFVNGLLIGGGTESFNSLVKLLASAKQVSEAKTLTPQATDVRARIHRVPNPVVLPSGTGPPARL